MGRATIVDGSVVIMAKADRQGWAMPELVV
jgi:hypothetical protein